MLFVIFVDRVLLEVEEHSDVILSFPEPALKGQYDELTWYKDHSGGDEYRMVFLRSSVNNGQPQYYNGIYFISAILWLLFLIVFVGAFKYIDCI